MIVSNVWLMGGWYCLTLSLQCLLMMSLKMIAFPLKLLAILLLTSISGITGIFLPLTRVLNTDHYDFDEEVGSLSLFARRS